MARPRNLLLYTILALVMIIGCRSAVPIGSNLDPGRLKDGTYTGTFHQGPNRAKVNVTIANGKIPQIQLDSHFASWIGHEADDIIPARIISNQSTRVDAVSGATNSSIVIMNAVQKAVEHAYR